MKTLETLPPLSKLSFGQHFCPWMIEANFAQGAWQPWKLIEAHNFQVHPAAKTLHYGQEIFEGLKVFRRAGGQGALFRPQKNIDRMRLSAEILAMPPYPEGAYLEAMRALIERCRDFIPEEPGSLYLRPTMLGMTPTLGVAAASEYVFYILASPVGGYFGAVQSSAPPSVSVWVTQEHVRAAPGGLGAAKTGANYAASLRAVAESKRRGFQNVLFLDAIERRYFQELSGMNIFVVEDGVLKTPPLGDTILDGVTRDTLLQIARSENIPVSVEDIDIQKVVADLRKPASAQRVQEVFACGTGASLTSIGELGWESERLKIGEGAPGPISTRLYRALLDTYFGRRPPLASDWFVTC